MKILSGFLAFFLIFITSPIYSDSPPPISIAVSMTPMGSFTIVAAKVSGKGSRKGAFFSATEISVAVADLDSQIPLRTTHLKEKLEEKTFPTVSATQISAQQGKGTAKITIRGISKDLSFSYTDLGKNLAQASFTLKLSDFGISGIKYLGIGVDDEVLVTATVPYEGQ